MAFADVIRTDAVFPASPPSLPSNPRFSRGLDHHHHYHRLSSLASAVTSNFLSSSFEKCYNYDEKTRTRSARVDERMETGKVQKRWKMVVTGEEEGKRTTRETDRPRGEGMQDIAAPRDTRGRNLHDGAGDVLQSCSPATTKSLGSHV